jgi:CRP-like cAMP-binding protein
MTPQRLLQVSYSDKDAKLALKLLIPSMAPAFNVDTLHGYLSVHGEDAQALAALLSDRIVSRIERAKSRNTKQSARTNARNQPKQ